MFLYNYQILKRSLIDTYLQTGARARFLWTSSTEPPILTVVQKTNWTLALLPSKMALLKREWQKEKVPSRPWASKSTLVLIRPLKWGTERLKNSQWFQKYQPSNLNNWKKSVLCSTKQTFFRLFKFDGWYFWNHWKLRDVMYLISKVWSVPKWT